MAGVSHEDRDIVDEPLLWQLKLKQAFGVSVKGAAPEAYKVRIQAGPHGDNCLTN